MSEQNLTEDDVREEHAKAVNIPAHWAYFLGVLVAGFLLMVLLIAFMGRGG